MSTYMGMPIIPAIHAETVEQDWSGCRSPSRARRRHARGIRTRMVETRKPAAFVFGGRLYAHPAFIQQLKLEMERMGSAAVNPGKPDPFGFKAGAAVRGPLSLTRDPGLGLIHPRLNGPIRGIKWDGAP